MISRLPVIAQPGRPAAKTAFVLSMPLMDTTVPDVRLVALSAPSAKGTDEAIARIGGNVVSQVMEEGHCEILAAVPFSVAQVEVESLTRLSDNPMVIRGTVGGYWSPIALSGPQS